MLKFRGLVLMGLLVVSGVTVGAMPAFAPTNTNLTVRNQSQSKPSIPVFQNAPAAVHRTKEAPKPAKHP
jgi:TolA-binding protein